MAKLGYILATDGIDGHRLLSGLAERLAARGHRVGGVVQSRAPSDGAHRCDMDLRVLPDGPAIALSQRLGKGSRGCRLDPASLERAAQAVQDHVSAEAEVLIVNKFGRNECEGRGFGPVIATAIGRDIPVVTAVNGLNHEDFLRFAGGLETRLAPDPEALYAWVARMLAPA